MLEFEVRVTTRVLAFTLRVASSVGPSAAGVIHRLLPVITLVVWTMWEAQHGRLP